MQVSNYDMRILNEIAHIEADIESLKMDFTRADIFKSRQVVSDMKLLMQKKKLRDIFNKRVNEVKNLLNEKKYLKEIKNICFLLQEPLYDRDNSTLYEIQKFSSNKDAIIYIENKILNNNPLLKNKFKKTFSTLENLKDDRATSKLLIQICKEIDICKKEVYFIDDDTMTLQKLKSLFTNNPLLKESFKNEYDTVFIKKELPHKKEREKIYHYVQTMYKFPNPFLMKLNDIYLDKYLDKKNKLDNTIIKLMASENNAWEIFKLIIKSANQKATLNISDELDKKLYESLDFYLFDTLKSVYYRKNECKCILNTIRNSITNTQTERAIHTYQFTYNKKNPDNSILKINDRQIDLTSSMYYILNSIYREENSYKTKNVKSQISKMNSKIKKQAQITDNFVINPKRNKIEQYKHLNYIIDFKFEEVEK